MHGRDAVEVHARDLKLDKFIDEKTLATAPTLPEPSGQVRTVLLTGATGFLGRFLALEWLERLAPRRWQVDLPGAGQGRWRQRASRLDKTFDSGDPALLAHLPRIWPPSTSR